MAQYISNNNIWLSGFTDLPRPKPTFYRIIAWELSKKKKKNWKVELSNNYLKAKVSKD